VWVVDYHRWKHQLLCNKGGLVFLEVDQGMEVYDYVGEKAGLRGNPARNTPPTPTPDDYIRCVNCGRLVLKRGKRHKYCLYCAKTKHRTQKRDWIRKRRSAS